MQEDAIKRAWLVCHCELVLQADTRHMRRCEKVREDARRCEKMQKDVRM